MEGNVMRPMVRGEDGVRRVINDEAWRQLRPVLARILSKRGAPPTLEVREFLEAVLYLERTGIPWRDMPCCFGSWGSVYQRFRRWQRSGIWERLWRELQIPGTREALRLFVDSTIVRAHQHAAGGAGNASEAKGRSRGGYTTKIHLAAADERTAVAIVITEGQAADAPHFENVMMNVPADECGACEVVADRAFDSDAIRTSLADADLKASIPSTANRTTPIPHDREAYKERNKVERLVNRLKSMRRVATRYEKLGCVFLAIVHIASAASILL
jgi:transposase